MHFVTILDPCISIGEPRGEYPPFDLVRILLGLLFKIRWFQGDELDIWVMDSDGEPLVAKVEMSRHRFRIMHIPRSGQQTTATSPTTRTR